MRTYVYAEDMANADAEIVRKTTAEGSFVGLRVNSGRKFPGDDPVPMDAVTLWFHDDAEMKAWVTKLAQFVGVAEYLANPPRPPA